MIYRHRPFTSARAVPYSSVVGCGIMLLNDKGASVAQLAIMAGDKERSDAISDELMKRIEDGGKFDRYAHIETTIKVNAARHGATEDEIAAFINGEKDFIGWVIKKVEPAAVRDVMVERLRQQTAEGYSAIRWSQSAENRVTLGLAMSYSDAEIAKGLGISLPTLRKYYFSALRRRNMQRLRFEMWRAEVLADQAKAAGPGGG